MGQEERREKKAAHNRAYQEANPDHRVEGRLRRTYGITLADYDEMLEAQDNRCAICGRTPEENGKRLAVDHDHGTNEVRGLLCSQCNQAIGLLQDSPDLCRLAAQYLYSNGR